MELRPRYPVMTRRLLLRPFTPGDIDAMLAYRGRADVCRYLPFEPQDRAALEARFETGFGRPDLTGEDQAITFGAWAASGEQAGRLLGDVILFYRSELHRGGEIGWVFDPGVSGHGYATEAATAVLRLAFEELGLHRVEAKLDARNARSAALCERLGMRLEAHLVENELFKGEWSDLLVYGLLRKEWSPSSCRSDLTP